MERDRAVIGTAAAVGGEMDRVGGTVIAVNYGENREEVSRGRKHPLPLTEVVQEVLGERFDA